jgi:hypothetical protein
VPTHHETSLDATRVWVELADPETPEGETPEQVFRFDVTWLTSSWTCIFGRGCHGIYADRPLDGCCTLGAHFSDADDEKRVRAHVKKLSPATWQRADRGRKRDGGWVELDPDGARKTRVVDGACIFLNDPGFTDPTGHERAGCALHHLAADEGVSFVQTKPDVCWQLPLRRTYRTVERPDGTSYLEVSVGEYDRRGWGEGGHDLDWYCTGNPEAHVGTQPVYLSNREELVELVGLPAYEAISRVCDQALGVHKRLPLFVHPATAAARAAGAATGARTTQTPSTDKQARSRT